MREHEGRERAGVELQPGRDDDDVMELAPSWRTTTANLN